MNSTATTDSADKKPQAHPIQVHVRYAAKGKPYGDKHEPAETLAQVKPKVLNFFTLKEGPVEGGGEKTYFFVLDGQEQTDLSQTLGALAGDKHEIKFNLVERLTQG